MKIDEIENYSRRINVKNYKRVKKVEVKDMGTYFLVIERPKDWEIKKEIRQDMKRVGLDYKNQRKKRKVVRRQLNYEKKNKIQVDYESYNTIVNILNGIEDRKFKNYYITAKAVDDELKNKLKPNHPSLFERLMRDTTGYHKYYYWVLHVLDHQRIINYYSKGTLQKIDTDRLKTVYYTSLEDFYPEEEYILCPSCGETISQDSDKCPICGEEL